MHEPHRFNDRLGGGGIRWFEDYSYGDQTPFRSIAAFGFASMAGLAVVYCV